MYYPPELKQVQLFGIDPGKSNGGIAKYTDIFQSFPLKAMADNFENMCDWFKEQADMCDNPLVVIEKITTHKKDLGVSNETDKQKSARIGRSYKMEIMKDHYVELVSAIKLSGMPYIEVMPHVWQKYVGIHIPNEDYKDRKKRYKEIAAMYALGHQVVGWNADAVLLIDFIKKKQKFDKQWVIRELKKNERKPKLFK